MSEQEQEPDPEFSMGLDNDDEVYAEDQVLVEYDPLEFEVVPDA